MKQKIKHIRVNHDEWVRVHRSAPPQSLGGGWETLAIKVGVWVGGFILACWVLKLLLPYLILCVIGWVLLFFGRR